MKIHMNNNNNKYLFMIFVKDNIRNNFKTTKLHKYKIKWS